MESRLIDEDRRDASVIKRSTIAGEASRGLSEYSTAVTSRSSSAHFSSISRARLASFSVARRGRRTNSHTAASVVTIGTSRSAISAACLCFKSPAISPTASNDTAATASVTAAPRSASRIRIRLRTCLMTPLTFSS